MVSGLGTQHRPETGAGTTPSPWLASLAAAVLPFDVILSGMVRAGHGLDALCCWLGVTRVILLDHVVRLGLSTPHARATRNPGRLGWNHLDVMRLIAWRMSGVHPESISLRLGRSPNAIRAKCRRLGLPAPDRKSLRKVDAALLIDPGLVLRATASSSTPPTSPEGLCGRAARQPGVSGGASPAHLPSLQKDLRSQASAPTSLAADPAFVAKPALRAKPGRRRNLDGQGELRLLRALGSSVDPAVAAPPTVRQSAPAILPPVPATEADVRFDGDLTWIRHLRKPLSSKVAVYAMSMLYFGGIKWRSIARRIGKTEAATRTLQSRCSLPRDHKRAKFSEVFHEEAARATLAESGFELARDPCADEWFWRRTCDRAVVRQTRKRRLAHGLSELYEAQEITLVTPGDLELRRRKTVPFASTGSMLHAC